MPISNEEDTREKRASAGVRSTVPFKYYIHDGVQGLRLQIIGSLQEMHVAELAGCWNTARTILGGRPLIVDLRALDSVDDAGKQWLLSLAHDGAQYLPESYFRTGLAGQNKPGICPNIGIMTRIFSFLRGRQLPVESSTRVR
jgi:hypothetical protein